MSSVQKICSKRIQVIWNGIDIDGFQTGNHENPKAELGLESKFVLVNVSRLHPQKDHATLIRAFQIVRKKSPGTHLLLVGDGPCRSKIEELVASMDLTQDVTITGFTNEVRKYLAASDIFVLSSLFEGISISLLEAIASGKPVVATRVEGNSEVIIHGVTGLLVPPQDPEMLADSILQIRSDSALRQRLASKSLQRLHEHFGLKAMAKSYYEIYEGFKPGQLKLHFCN
jgi:glycosyltransferase involved in cell wall biosynthesis